MTQGADVRANADVDLSGFASELGILGPQLGRIHTRV